MITAMTKGPSFSDVEYYKWVPSSAQGEDITLPTVYVLNSAHLVNKAPGKKCLINH